MKLLTISIAGYNIESYIHQTLDSLICRHIDKLEIFVVDDGGNDHTLEIAQSYARKYPNSIIPVHKENGGWGSTVNYSISHATGKYFKLLDGDDFFDTASLDGLLEHLEAIDSDVIYTPYTQYDDEAKKNVKDFDISSNYELYTTYNLYKINPKFGLDMHAVMFKTSILKNNQVRITEKCFYTDNEYRTKGLAYSQTILFTNLSLYRYRIGREGQSVDLTGLKKHYKDSIQAAKALITFHQSLHSHIPPYINECVKNGVRFAFWTLIVLDLKDEFCAFNTYTLQAGTLYYEAGDIIVRLLRTLHFNLFSPIAFLTKMKYTIAIKVKRLL